MKIWKEMGEMTKLFTPWHNVESRYNVELPDDFFSLLKLRDIIGSPWTRIVERYPFPEPYEPRNFEGTNQGYLRDEDRKNDFKCSILFLGSYQVMYHKTNTVEEYYWNRNMSPVSAELGRKKYSSIKELMQDYWKAWYTSKGYKIDEDHEYHTTDLGYSIALMKEILTKLD